ncbi:E3 ubiquitin-protein ligase SH3RF1-like isoform X1 [Coregonus clupeaformis]|uniref:E3 ubiquitin-protein ligase SH3RF1-like isoform X1 n=1 Tax=Coregonus clupeaformis TaxID=59861 RepID=UPI001E1C5D7A|nr:E3 ubiquitin-protein ligase SH3RF1-like isoform X1 [Coregonus clupeaformis]
MGPVREWNRPSARYMISSAGENGLPRGREAQQQHQKQQQNPQSDQQHRERQPGQNEVIARALYNHRGNVPGVIDMASGDIIVLTQKVDENWYYGDTNSSSGLVAANMIQIIHQQHQTPPQSPSQSQSQSQPKTQQQAESQPKSQQQAESQPKSQQQAESQPKSQQQAESQPKSQQQAESQPKSQQQAESQPKSQFQKQSQSQTQPHFQSQPLALCKALYDFDSKQMDVENCKDCLTFHKGDVLTVIRRADENWIEGKLGDKVGIFPLQFTEPNTAAAAKLLEGKIWKGSDSSAESRPGIGSGSGVSNSGTGDSTNPNRSTCFGATQSPTKTPNISALNPPTTTQGIQQQASSSTLYKSNQTQPSNINGLYQSTQAQQLANINSVYQPTQGQPPSVSALNSLNHQGQQSQLSHPSAPPPNHSSSHRSGSGVTSQRVKRSSERTGRHLSQQAVRKMSSGETPPTITMALINPQTPSASADTKQSSTQQLSISVCAALYSYKPCRSEELELRKGEMVGVYGKFKEGWLRGLSLRTGKVGILPGNYVTPVLRTSATLLESKPVMAGLGTVPGKRTSSSSKTPAVVLALHRVNSDETSYSTGQRVPQQSASMATQPVMSSGGAARQSHGVGSEGWDTVRKVFHRSHRGSSQRGNHNPHTTISSSSAFQSQTQTHSQSSSQNSSQRCNHYPHTTSATSGVQPHSQSHSHSQNFSHIQAPGYSPALLRKKQHISILPNHNRSLAWMSEGPAPSSGGSMKDRDTAAREAFDRQVLETRQAASNGQHSIHSILVRPDALKDNTEKPTKSVRFLTQPDSPPPQPRITSLPSGSQPPSSARPGPPPLEVWAPSLTLGRDGPGIILKEGKAPVLRKGLETNPSDVLTSNQKPTSSSSSSSSAPSASIQSSSPTRHRVATSYQAQMESEMSLMQGEPVLLHRHRPDGRVLLTQESSGHTGLFHSSVLQFLDRFS